MRRRRKRRIQGDVELNLAAMLDMAFQLLAFFILTFKPGPVEGQIALRMPSAMPVTQVVQSDSAPSDAQQSEVTGIDTLALTILANDQGAIKSMRVAQGEPITDFPEFEDRLKTVFADPATPFGQVVLQVDPKLRYEYVMQLLDLCTRIKMADGQQLNHLSFVELSGSNDAAP